MSKPEKTSGEEAKKLLKWILNNPSEWHIMSRNHENNMDTEDCIKHIEMLEENELYTAIIYSISSNMVTPETATAMNYLMFSKLIADWEDKDISDICDEVKTALKRAIEIKHNRGYMIIPDR